MRVVDNGGPHTEAAHFALNREWQNVQTVATFTVDGEPASKSRARFSKRGSKTVAYTPEKTKIAEEKVAWLFRAAAPGHKVDATHQFGVFALFFAGTNQRRDVDNMLKLICDGLNKITWADDSQVAEVSARRGIDHPENARTEIWIYRLGELDNGKRASCKHCGARYRTYDSWVDKKKFCSPACTEADRKSRWQNLACKHCGKEFQVKPSDTTSRYCSRPCANEAKKVSVTCVICGSTYRKAQSLATAQAPVCSHDCRAAYWREHRKTAARGTCTDCGGPTSKKTYARCAACARKAASA